MSSTRLIDPIDNRRRRMVVTLVFVAGSLLASCASADRYSAVPEIERKHVTALGISNARFFADETAAMAEEQNRALVREAENLGATHGAVLPTAAALSLSGGGDGGAFGAGLLVGWTAHGDRPRFKLVTG